MGVAGLRPFNFLPKNNVHWLGVEDGIVVDGYGQANGIGSMRGLGSGTSREFSVELFVASFKGRRKSIESILSIVNQRKGESFAIEIWTVDLVIAGWFHDTGSRKTFFDRLFCGQVFDTTHDHFVTVTSGDQGVTVYVDGISERSYPRLTLVPENFDGKLLLGQPAEGHQDWRGAIKGLALFDKAISRDRVVADFAFWKQGRADEIRSDAPNSAIYPFHERRGRMIKNEGTTGGILQIPELVIPARPVVLKIPTTRDLENWSDVILNLVGLVPLGFLLLVYLRKTRSYTATRAVLTTVFIGFVTSLSIELLQVYLPSRDSSLLDVIMNTSGVLIGASLGMVVIVLVPHKKSAM